MSRWPEVLGGVAVVVSGVVTVPHWVGFALAIMGTLLVAHDLWGRNAPVGRWGEWVPDRWYWNGSDPTRPALVRLTPLKRAANKAYAANKDNLVGAAAEHPWLGGESTPTHWLATALVLREDSKVRVFGSRPELKKLEPVPADVLRRAHLSESMDQLEETHPTRILYQKLMVSKSDAKRRAKIVGGWAGFEGRGES